MYAEKIFDVVQNNEHRKTVNREFVNVINSCIVFKHKSSMEENCTLLTLAHL